jgi:hypothetical protein
MAVELLRLTHRSVEDVYQDQEVVSPPPWPHLPSWPPGQSLPYPCQGTKRS